MLKDNPRYKIAFTYQDVNLYMPVDITDYHKSREVAMAAQEKYSNAGVSKEVLQEIATKAIEICNKQLNLDTLRTDMGVLWNNLLARMKSPVDEYCAIRMGAIACFLEDENPDIVQEFWTRQKVDLAFKNPELYSFFLSMGIGFTPEYYNLSRTLNWEIYLQNRDQMLESLMPITFKTK